MTSKVEEILDKLERGFMPRGTYTETWKLIDAALAAARSEGVVEGAEKESRRWLGAIECAVKEGTLSEFVRDALDNISVLAPEVKS